MKKICIMAGHQNAGAGMSKGAPGEVDFNIDVANQVSGALRDRGFEVKQTDANAHKDNNVTKVNWDLFLSIHYDADVYNTSGGFTDYPEPSTDGATVNSQKAAKDIADQYFKVTKIKNFPNRSNANTRYFYMWSYLTKSTPCVIIECGVGWRVPDDHNLFTYDRNLVIEGIVRGICDYCDIPYDLEPEIPCEKEVKSAVVEAKAKSDASWQPKLATANKKIENLEKKLLIQTNMAKKNLNPVLEALKEPARLCVLAILPIGITYFAGLDASWAIAATLLLKTIDKYLHKSGTLELGLTRF